MGQLIDFPKGSTFFTLANKSLFVRELKKILVYLNVAFTDACCGDEAESAPQIYKANLGQLATQDPTETILENGLGAHTLVRDDVGKYHMTFDALAGVDPEKVFLLYRPALTTDPLFQTMITFSGELSQVLITTWYDGDPADEVLQQSDSFSFTSLEIQLYP